MKGFTLTTDEIIGLFTFRSLNSKTNNLIITDVKDFKVLDRIPKRCEFTYKDDLFYGPAPTTAHNIAVDLKTTPIEDIIDVACSRIHLKTGHPIKLKDLRTSFKLQNRLEQHGIVLQLILFGIEELTPEEQMLLNELFYVDTPFFNVCAFTKKSNLATYFLQNGRVLDRRENFLQISLAEEMTPQPKESEDKKMNLKTVPHAQNQK